MVYKVVLTMSLYSEHNNSSSGSLDYHTTLNENDDLELEVFVFNLFVTVGVIFKLDFIDFFYILWCLLIIFYLSLSSQVYITLVNINSNCITLLVNYITSRTVQFDGFIDH